MYRKYTWRMVNGLCSYPCLQWKTTNQFFRKSSKVIWYQLPSFTTHFIKTHPEKIVFYCLTSVQTIYLGDCWPYKCRNEYSKLWNSLKVVTCHSRMQKVKEVNKSFHNRFPFLCLCMNYIQEYCIKVLEFLVSQRKITWEFPSLIYVRRNERKSFV